MKFLILCLVLTFASAELCASDSILLLETGALWQERNDVRIPSSTGTLVGFDEYNSGPFFHYRFELHHPFNHRHGIRVIYAPLGLSVTGRESRAVNYNNVIFTANTPTTIDYKFNSYRLGYTYRVWGEDKSFLRLGLTGKIRQASIRFTQNSLTTIYDNVGFVPLFYYALQVPLSGKWTFYSDSDFAFAKQGRAVDITFKLRYGITGSSSIGFGARALEGGADNDKVLTYTFVKYAVLDFTLAW